MKLVLGRVGMKSCWCEVCLVLGGTGLKFHWENVVRGKNIPRKHLAGKIFAGIMFCSKNMLRVDFVASIKCFRDKGLLV